MRSASLMSVALLFLAGSLARADTLPVFGVLKSMEPAAAKAQVEQYLKDVGKTDQATKDALKAIWTAEELSLTDRVGDSIALGNPAAAKLLADARDHDQAAPKQVPQILTDKKLPVFARASLALAYGKALSNRRVFEQALAALQSVRAEDVVEPAAYLFHMAVAQHGMVMKKEATSTIARLLDDVADAPDRYKMVATLMFFDMQGWKEKDLASISRKMDNIERRLDLARGGPKTQKMQREVVYRLDELIKKLEQQQQGGGGGGGGGGNGGQCPEGGQPGNSPGNTNQPSAPQNDSIGGKNGGPGQVDPKKLKELVEAWGKLPERDRVKAMTEMVRDMPPAYRQMIEDYYRKIASSRENR